MPRTWLITGCSSGFGRILSQRAFDRGDRVVATARKIETLTGLCTTDEDRVLRLSLDVREADQIQRVVKETMTAFGRIDVLVNNAGYGYFSTQEEGAIEEIRAMYETNVFGLLSVTQAVLPHMRQQRSGTIMNVSSVAGTIGTPRSGLYQSSKWAVEALSESLYLEVSSFGLRVVLIQPGLYDTDFGPRSARVGRAEDDRSSPYSDLRPVWRENARGRIFDTLQDPNDVVEAMLQAADSHRSFLRVPVGKDTRMLTERRASMPDGEFVEWMRSLYHEGYERRG